MRRHILAMLALVIVAGCGKTGGTISEWFGATDKPQKAPVFYDELCDASSGSTCSAETLRETSESVLREAGDRPGSIIRLWMQGRTIEGTRLRATAPRPGLRATGPPPPADAGNPWVA